VTAFAFCRLVGAIIGAMILLLPGALAAQASMPSSQREAARGSPAGNYLAARHALMMRDAAAAAAFFRSVLQSDPRNSELLERTFIATLANGDIEEAVRLADRIVQIDRGHRLARIVLGIRALKQKQYPLARQHFAQASGDPITDLIAAMLSGWAFSGSNDLRAAVEVIDRVAGPDWYALFKDLHAGLILDLAGSKEAGKRFERAYRLNPSLLRLVEAYGGWLSRHASKEEALKVFQTFDGAFPRHPLIVHAMQQLADEKVAAPPLRLGQVGEVVKRVQSALGLPPDGVFGPSTERAVKEFQRKHGLQADGVVGPTMLAKLKLRREEGFPLLVASPQEGAAEALYGIGSALGRQDNGASSLVYLQLALYLAPPHPLALLSLAELHEQHKNHQLAIKVYARVPQDSVLRRNAEIQLAAALDTLDRTEEATKRLEKLIEQQPNDLEAIMALGNILRGRKRYQECARVYGRGIASLPEPGRPHWTIFYFRGICNERAKQWEKAEPDFKMALKLYPDQPHVLNYLGYSWIDQGVALEEGMRMIRRAVEQRPDDGYIVDSLGWAYYRLGDYEEAVKHLERAVELRPDDPTINDHLGDVYWRLGRTLEARFQWTHARDLKPEPEELAKILQKLQSGLPEEPASAAAADKPKPPANGG